MPEQAITLKKIEKIYEEQQNTDEIIYDLDQLISLLKNKNIKIKTLTPGGGKQTCSLIVHPQKSNKNNEMKDGKLSSNMSTMC